MVIILQYFVTVLEATIGFTEPSYTVLEGQGSVSMVVRVLSGEIPPGSTVDVTFSTSDLTAIGLPENLSGTVSTVH